MSRLVTELTKALRERMQSVARSLPGDKALRTVFHGPPRQYLEAVLNQLEAEGGLDVELGNGERAVVPVLLPIESIEGLTNPPVNHSGLCDDSHILALRNTPACPRFVILATPARQSILSVAQATDEFGLSPEANGASAEIEMWLQDSFVRRLVRAAASRILWKSDLERDGAQNLLESAIKAADEADHHDLQRHHAWAVVSRVFHIGQGATTDQTQWSLACGVPPISDGGLDASHQTAVLDRFARAMVDEGFGACIARLKQHASLDEQGLLDECAQHIERACEVKIALQRSAQYYYGPFRDDVVDTPPAWWLKLTAERLAELLEEEGERPADAISIECSNPLLPARSGVPAIVRDVVELELSLPPGVTGPVDLTVTRTAGSQSSTTSWAVQIPTSAAVSDAHIAEHRRPIRYVVHAPGFKKSTVRVVSLAHWEPGVVVACRTASELSLPRKMAKGSGLECVLTMEGEGRHYLELHVAPGVAVLDEVRGQDAATGAGVLEGLVTQSAPDSYALELVATTECTFDIPLRSSTTGDQLLRLQITCEELPEEGCRSEFDRLIRLNRDREQRTTTTVQLDRQVRLADLQGWLLEKEDIGRSHYPIALGLDCRDAWKAPIWKDATGTILSKARFIHDPRPLPDEFEPPTEWVLSRQTIAARVRGDDGYGMFEAGEFATWLKDKAFADAVDTYVRSYCDWLAAAPDVASWVDLAIVCRTEGDGKTLAQDPDAVIVSPLHPLRVGWHCVAQRALLEAWQANRPCPAASILNPDSVPDILPLPLRTPTGAIKHVMFLSTDCSSDYWSVLWNANRLGALSAHDQLEPFDEEFGLQLGGVSSGFSESQVRRSLDDLATLLSAKPVLNVLVSSSSGRSDACNEGIMSWARSRFSEEGDATNRRLAVGKRLLHVLDERRHGTPEAAAVANLSEDTAGAVRWFKAAADLKPDLGIIAQLETANASMEMTNLRSPLSTGALVRHRIRTQLRAGSGAFLTESRMGVEGPASGDGLANHVARGVARLENLGDVQGYTFAPSVQSIRSLLQERNAEYVAVSSAALDPSCFLGGWLNDVYLWDYELPSYSRRAGDTNGYYLLSKVKQIDCEGIQALFARFPDCQALDDDFLRNVLLEVARRGIPTIRGLSANHTGASGDLGLFLAGRLLQDRFRIQEGSTGSMLRVLATDGNTSEVAVVVPVDPFRHYLLDLQRALAPGPFLRPDLLIATFVITDSAIRCRLTPVEVKYRRETMAQPACSEALAQAASLSGLLSNLEQVAASPDLLIWKLAFQHLLASMIDFGFRVYSQHLAGANTPDEWSGLHQRVLKAVLSDELGLEIDRRGRLILFDGSGATAARDLDNDGFKETLAISPVDAAKIVNGDPSRFYHDLRLWVGEWGVFPDHVERVVVPEEQPYPQTDTPQTNVTTATEQPESVPATYHVAKHDAGGTVADHPIGLATPMMALREQLRIRVGDDVEKLQPEQRYFCPSNTELSQLNMGIVGDLGTGKTQLIKSLVYQMANGGIHNDGIAPRFLIFDYKKDYRSQDFVEAVGARVVSPQQIPLNVFDTSTLPGQTVAWMNRFLFFADVLDKIYGNVGPVQRSNLKTAVKQAYDDCAVLHRQPTIYDVHDRYKTLLKGKSDSPLAIISDIVDQELFTSEADVGTSFDDFFRGVVVLSLDALPDDRTKNMLVVFMLNMFYDYMLSIPKRPFVGTSPQLRTIDSYLLVDEADNIMKYEFDVLKRILLQGREFGVGVMLASQYLKHFKAGATDYRDPLLTWFIHKVPNISPQELSALGLGSASAQVAEHIKQLANHHCLYKTFGVDGEFIHGLPFYKLRAAPN